MLCSLVLELRHALHFADIGDGIEDPGKLRMRGDVRLDIERALLGIDAAGDVERRKLQGMTAQLRGDLAHGDGVQIGDRVKTGKFVLQLHPVADGAHIVADGQISARLNGRI